METLAIKLAELLDITVEAAIKLLPILRNQYVWYKVLGMVSGFGFAFMLIMASGLFVFSLVIFEDYPFEEDDAKTFKKYLFGLVALVVLGLTMFVGAKVARIMTAPDLMMILEFTKGKF